MLAESPMIGKLTQNMQLKYIDESIREHITSIAAAKEQLPQAPHQGLIALQKAKVKKGRN